MAKLVVLTPVSYADLEQVIRYLHENWGVLVCDRFITRFEQVCDIISATPKMFPLVNKKKNIRKCVLTHQNSIYYREQVSQIEIIAIFDTRQDPDKLSEFIKKA